MEYLRCKCTQAEECFIPGKMRTHGKHFKSTITNKTRAAGSFSSSYPGGPPCRPGVLCICLFSGTYFEPKLFCGIRNKTERTTVSSEFRLFRETKNLRNSGENEGGGGEHIFPKNLRPDPSCWTVHLKITVFIQGPGRKNNICLQTLNMLCLFIEIYLNVVEAFWNTIGECWMIFINMFST